MNEIQFNHLTNVIKNHLDKIASYICDKIIQALKNEIMEYLCNRIVDILFEKIKVHFEPIIYQMEFSKSVNERQLLTQEEAAVLFGISYGTVKNWVHSGKIIAYKVPNSKRSFFDYDELVKLKTSTKVDKRRTSKKINKRKEQ